MWRYYRWLFELPDIIRYWGLPRGCWHCEVLGLCRRPKKEGWKCYNGCMVLNWENERKYEGLIVCSMRVHNFVLFRIFEFVFLHSIFLKLLF